MSATRRDLVGKVAIVTGSSRGIGAAIALRLAEHGASVVINYLGSADAAKEVALKAQREHGVSAISVQADVSKEGDVARLFETAKRELGRVDIVMSNSGIEHFNDLENTTGEEFDKVFAINVKGQFFIAQQTKKHVEDGGRLMLISSVSAVKGIPRHAVYAASKAAVIGMAKCLAWDLGTRNITVNVIAPGGIKSDMYAENARRYVPGGDKLSEDEVEEFHAKMSPLNRVGMPDDVAGVVALLASPEAQWITGQTIHVGGGVHMA